MTKQIRIADGAAFLRRPLAATVLSAGVVKLVGGIDNLSSDPASRAKIQLAGLARSRRSWSAAPRAQITSKGSSAGQRLS
jgi:hypothetical protein